MVAEVTAAVRVQSSTMTDTGNRKTDIKLACLEMAAKSGHPDPLYLAQTMYDWLVQERKPVATAA